jgi:hypothetical protein
VCIISLPFTILTPNHFTFKMNDSNIHKKKWHIFAIYLILMHQLQKRCSGDHNYER